MVMKRRYLFFFMLLLTAVYGFSVMPEDNDPLKNLLSKLERLRDEYPQEKVHIHTDKPYYSIGDSIWFKAYVVNAEKNELSNLSKILYVELIDEKNSIQKTLRLPVTGGLAWGDFILADSLSEGNYRIRAYTSWMRNFGEEYFFDKIIKVGSAQPKAVVAKISYTFSKIANHENVKAEITYADLHGEPLANKEVSYNVELDARNIAKGRAVTDANGRIIINFTNTQPFLLKTGKIMTSVKQGDKATIEKVFTIKTTSGDVDIQFFPEGGQLVDGIRSKVGFKAVGSDGLSREVSGSVVDKNNKIIGTFTSEHAGMGTFVLTPETGNSYRAIVKFNDGSTKEIGLPQSLPSGYVLNVNPANRENLSVRISASPDLLGKGEVTLVAQCNGVVKYVARNTLNERALSAMIPKNRFSTGILQLTLFSPSYQPVAERLVFIRRADEWKVQVHTDKDAYRQREKVKMNLKVSDTTGKPVIANFSVAVINESKVPYDDTNEMTILSNLLLTSDIKGYVERPNYYFMDVTSEKEQQLDNLMLTQGWRRFIWKNILTDISPVITFQPEKGLHISGMVKTPGGKPVVGGRVLVLSSRGNGMLLDTLTDSQGRFSFENLFFTDSTRFVIQARNANNKKNVDIILDQVPPQLVTKSKNLPDLELEVNASLLPYLQARENDLEEMRKRGMFRQNILLKEVKIVEKKVTVPHSSNLNGAGNADAIITADRLQNCISLDQCLQGLVAGVIIRNGIAYSTRSLYRPMQLILDGMYVDPDFLSTIPPTDVESIEVLRTPGNTTIYGMRGGNGVLIINTKRGGPGYSYKAYVPGITTFNPLGYYVAREFYSPNYDQPKINQELPDRRSTIFWAPNLTSNQVGTAQLEFFTAGEPGTYKVVIEGLDGKGTVIREVSRFEVR